MHDGVKASKVWTMDFIFYGQRIRETTETRSKTLAVDIERKRRRQLEEGAPGLKSKRATPVFGCRRRPPKKVQ
jgi:hypothetical protein